MNDPVCKRVGITPPAAKVDDASATTAALDTRGFDYCRIVVYLGDIDAAMTVLKVQESDAAGSGFTDVTGLVFGTSDNLTGSTSSLPGTGDDDDFFVFDIDLRGRKRYLDIAATVGSASSSTGAYLAIWAELSGGETTPDTATERGCNQVLQVPV